MRSFASSLALALSVGLSACSNSTVPGIVETVQEVELRSLENDARYYEHPLVPEVAWQIEVRLQDGSEVVVTQTGDRRYAPGDRVRILRTGESALLL